MKEEQLIVGRMYKVATGNIFTLFQKFHPNKECFQRQDGSLHFGREFVEFRDGERIIDLEEDKK